MPLSDREYFRGVHPPYCTCVDCVNKRLKRFRKGKEGNNRRFSPSIRIKTSSLIVAISIIFLIGIFGYVLNRHWLWVSETYENISESVVSFFSNAKENIEDIDIVETVEDIFTNDTSVENYEEIFSQYRQSKGHKPLIFTDDLNRIATLRLAELKGDYSHNSKGFYNKYLGENIVEGTYNNQATLKCWQNSYLHNANMLDKSYKYTGYAAGGGYAVQVFTEWKTINGVPQLPPGWYSPD